MATIKLSPSNISSLTPECLAFLYGLCVEIIDEDLKPEEDGSLVYVTRYRDLLAHPRPCVRKIGTDGTCTTLYDPDDYSLDLTTGEVTLVTALSAGEVLRIDYFFQPINDTILTRLLTTARREISVLVHRPISSTSTHEDYKAAICKRLYTNVLKVLAMEARNYFSLSVDGRSISKDQIVGHLTSLWKANEEDLKPEINQLRYWNKTDRWS